MSKIVKRVYKNGDYYKGPLINDLPTPEGEYVYVNGDVYKGGYVGDYPSGKGKISYKNGDAYIGTVRRGRPNGKGEKRYADGRRFVGRFFRGKRMGKGVMYFTEEYSTTKFEGYYFNDNPIYGTDFYPDGRTETGRIRNDRMRTDKKVTIKYPDGHVYEGTLDAEGFFLKGKFSILS